MSLFRPSIRVTLAALHAALAVTACGSSDGSERTLRVDLSTIELGDYRADTTPTLAEIIDVFGEPDACEVLPETAFASATWRELGLAVVAGRLSPIPGGSNACAAPSEVFVSVAEVTGEGWRTTAGLSIGDAEARVGELYPYARRGPSRPLAYDGWWIVVKVTEGAMLRPLPAVLAKISGGRVVGFVVNVGGEGI